MGKEVQGLEGCRHFGVATDSFASLTYLLPPEDGAACRIDALEAAVADLLQTPTGAGICEAYGGRRNCLLRFFQARDCNVRLAAEMLRETALWREENLVNDLRKMGPLDARSGLIGRLRPYWPGYTAGLTVDGSPVLYTNVSAISPLMCEFDEEALRLLYLGWMERSLELQVQGQQQRRAQGHAHAGLPQNIEVFDFGGVSALHVARKAFMLVRAVSFLGIGVAHYPEHLRKCYIINAPRMFVLFNNIVINGLPAATRRKIEICQDSRALREFMSPDQIAAMTRFSTQKCRDHAAALEEVAGAMAAWKLGEGLKRFAEL